jgi:putative peptidoglycan lipid II flippase
MKLSVQSWASASVLLIAVACLSKGLGFFRELLIAKYFGVSGDVDAFIIALSLALLAGSGIGIALSTMLIPAVHKLQAGPGKKRAAWFVGKVIVTTGLLSVLVTLPLMLFPEGVVRVFAPVLSERVVSMTTSFAPWLAVYALLLNLVFVLSAAFNAQGHFVVPAFSDLAFNVVAISILVMFADPLGIGALVVGSILGLAACVGILYILMRVNHLAEFGMKGPRVEMWPFLYLSMPILVWEFSCQIITAIENYFASGLAEGSIAALNYARRVSVVMVTLVALNISRGVFPTFSLLWLEGKRQEVAEILTRISSTVITIFVPVAVCCVALRDQVLGLLYMRGAFDSNALKMTAGAFVFYSVGLIVAVFEPIFIKACYAVGDTKTPLSSTVISAFMAALGAFLLTPILGIAGIALIMNLAIALRAILMALALNRTLRYFNLGELGARGLSAIVCAGSALACSSVILHETPLGLMMWCLVFATTYLSCGWFFLEGEIRPLVWRFARFGSEMWRR